MPGTFGPPDSTLQPAPQEQVPPELRPRPGDLVKLKAEAGVFYDPQTRFIVSGRQSARLTEPVGRLTAEKIAGGGLIAADPSSERPAA
jgi:hypothetical protein